MEQGGSIKAKPGGKPIKANSGRANKHAAKAKSHTPKGNPLQISKNQYRGACLENRDIGKAIDKKNEQSIAAKVLQAGGRLGQTDLISKGKEFNRDRRRLDLKKKVGKVEQKLNSLKAGEAK